MLTEEEYREQSNVETRKALEDLRRYTGALQRKMRVHSILSRFCQSPSSNPWKMVTKVRNPGRLVSFLYLLSNQFRFAEFVDGSPHLTEEEVMSYSTWSSDDEEDRRYTDLPDHLFEEMTDDEEEMTELGHRFWCSLCAPIHLGHRFTCGLCAFQATTKGR